MGEVASPHGLDEQGVRDVMSKLGIGDIGSVLLAELPDPALWSRRTIWVTDLWSSLGPNLQGGRMVSEGGAWKPLRPLVAATMAVADLAVVPFVTPTTLIMNNAGLLGLGITKSVTLGKGTGYAVPYPGYRQRVVKPRGALGVLNVVGLLTGAINGWADYEWDTSQLGWVQTASGPLL
jgi:hypothetical protein